jgi:starch phosphorylase
VPNCSILDGWWIEGHREGDTNGWGLKSSILTGADRDTEDANTIYEVLENKIVPLYYRREADGVPHDWIQVAKEAIRTIAPQFSARRMVIDYIDKLYMQAAGVEDGERPTARKS